MLGAPRLDVDENDGPAQCVPDQATADIELAVFHGCERIAPGIRHEETKVIVT